MALRQFFIFITDTVIFILKLSLFLFDKIWASLISLRDMFKKTSFTYLKGNKDDSDYENNNISLFDEFKQYLTKNFNIKNNDQELIIFKQLQNDFLKEDKNSFNIEGFINNLVQKLLFNKRIFLISFIAVCVIFIMAFVFLSTEMALALVLFLLLIFSSILLYPKIKKDNKYREFSRDLPFALRHLSTELKSGKGLHDSLNSVVNADYGILSSEFERVLNEIKYGKSTEQALMDMVLRIKSQGLSRAVQQIIGTLKIGGNLANTLSIIAEDVSFDMRIKLKEYSQKLNGFVMIYTFVAILAPVILLIMMVAASTVMGDFISTDLILILYIFFFPLLVVFMGLFIKKLEPQV